jgi:hypothetical protein
VLRIAAILFLVTHFFQAFQGLEKLLLRTNTLHYEYANPHRSEPEKSKQIPPAENMPSDFETVDADTENDALDEFVPLHQNYIYRNFILLPVPSSAARMKDLLHHELLCPPPEHSSFA